MSDTVAGCQQLVDDVQDWQTLSYAALALTFLNVIIW